MRRLAIRLLLALPAPLLRLVAGQSDAADEDQALDLRFRSFARLATRCAAAAAPSVDGIRSDPPIGLALLDDRPRESVKIEDLWFNLPGRTLRAKLYRPNDHAPVSPLLVFFHLGGGVSGTLATCETACSIIADEGRIVVLSLAYRLAPEDPYPAAVDDACDAFRWCRQRAASLGIDAARIAVAGDSAGGHLAGAVCLQQRDLGLPLPALQVLIYPVTNWDRSSRRPTAHDNAYPLTRELMDWFCSQYLQSPGQALEPRCSLCRIEDVAGLPPALFALAGHDLLREEGAAFAARLSAAGVNTAVHTYANLPHAFSLMTGAIPAAREAMIQIGRRAGEWLRNSPAGR